MTSHNGLQVFSDFHKCEFGLLGVNNIYVDEHLNVRTVEKLRLPVEKKLNKSQLLIPTPEAKKKYTTLEIASISNVTNFRFVMVDLALRISLNVGKVDTQREQPIFNIESNQQTVQLKGYESEYAKNNHIKAWMKVFIDLLEKLPPTNFGLLIESLRHIQSLVKIEPTSFHINLIKTILVSHEIFFEAGSAIDHKGELLEKTTDMYGSDVSYEIAILLNQIEKSPELPLIEFTKSSDVNLIDLIYMILILEQEDVIIVRRPKFIEFE